MLRLSYSMASTFRGCPKKFYWRYIEGLKPIKKTSILSLGSILHAGFDLFYKGAGDTFVYDFISHQYDETISKEEMADREPILLDKYAALGMWLYFPYKKEYTTVFSEEEFEVQISPDVMFVGKVDGRVSKNGNWWVRELKVTGMDERKFEGRCQTSSQGTGYVFGLKKYPIRGIMYEYIKRPMLRKGIKETAEEFGRRIMRDYKERPRLYFDLYPSYRNPIDLQNFEFDTALVANEILDKMISGLYYRNQDQCWNFGEECPYMKICFEEQPDPLTMELYYTRRGGEGHGENGNGDDSGRP